MSTLVHNRVAKARRFIDFLDAHLPADADVEAIAAFDDDKWAVVAQFAGERPPSAETQACIVTGLRERRRPLDDSLLEGLPG